MRRERSRLCFAGLWRPMPQGGDAFTLLTTDPSEDVAPIHDRQMVILDRSNWSAWLQETGKTENIIFYSWLTVTALCGFR